MNDQTLTVQGAEIPKVGLGTWQLTGRECVTGVAAALDAGYRHIDTARMYENEREVGEGLRESGVARDDVWLTTKAWMSHLSEDRLKRSLDASLRDLGVDHVDLFLIHWHNPEVPLAETLGAMRAQQEQGLVRHIGVSNFTTSLVQEALQHAPLLANQVEYHPYLDQRAVHAQAVENDLVLEAYSPFAHGRLLGDPVLEEIGAAHGKTPGQVALRWLLDQQNVVALPKATAPERIAQNLDVFDFELTDDQRSAIEGLERGERTADPPWAPAWDEKSRP